MEYDGIPHGVHWKSIFPSRKSRKSGVWLSRHFFRRPSANAELKSLRDELDFSYPAAIEFHIKSAGVPFDVFINFLFCQADARQSRAD